MNVSYIVEFESRLGVCPPPQSFDPQDNITHSCVGGTDGGIPSL